MKMLRMENLETRQYIRDASVLQAASLLFQGGSRGGKIKQNFYDKKPVRFFLRLNKDITKPGPRRDDDDGR